MPVVTNSCTLRQRGLWDALKKLDPPCDAMLITSPHNLRYLTGFTGSSGLASVTGADTWFITDPRYELQAAQEVTGKARAVKGSLLNYACKLIERKKWRRVGFEQGHLTAGQLDLLRHQTSKRQDFVPRGGEVEKLRI